MSAAAKYLVMITGLLALLAQGPACGEDKPADLVLKKIEGATPRNIIFVLADDHRYDAIGFLGHPFLKTPQLDSLATGGAMSLLSTTLWWCMNSPVRMEARLGEQRDVVTKALGKWAPPDASESRRGVFRKGWPRKPMAS